MSGNNLFLTLDFASKNCEYYKGTDYNDIRMFNVVDINEYRKNLHLFLPKEYSGKALKSLHSFRFINHKGNVQSFYWNTSEMIKSNHILWRYRKSFYGITTMDRCCCSNTITPYGFQIKGMDKYVINNGYMSVNNAIAFDSMPFTVIDAMINYRPDWYLFPDALLVYLFQILSLKYDKSPFKLKLIEYYGRQLDDNLKHSMEAFFDCRIVYVFGMNYLGVAYENSYGKLKIIDENVFVEDYNNCICVTDLINKSCPIIRHDTGYRGYVLDGNIMLNDNEYRCRNSGSIWVGLYIDFLINEINRNHFNAIYQYKSCEENRKLYLQFFIEPEYENWKEIISQKIYNRINECIKINDEFDEIIVEVSKL